MTSGDKGLEDSTKGWINSESDLQARKGLLDEKTHKLGFEPQDGLPANSLGGVG